MKFFAMERRAFLAYAAKRQAILSRFDPKAVMDMWGKGEDEPNEEQPGYTTDETGAAHIPVSGVLVKSADWIDTFLASEYGMEMPCTYQGIIAAAQAADADPGVTRIVFDVDSPGGDCDGVDKAAQAIMALKKPCEARVDYMAASAAFWLSSQADQIIGTSPIASFGSIGVLMVLWDWSKAMDEMGISEVVITSTDAPDKFPDIATKEGIATLRKELDSIHQVFAERVATGRRCSIEKVNTEFGRGALVFARDAVKVGMIDALNERLASFAPPDEDMDQQGDEPSYIDKGEDGAVGATAAAEAAESQGGEGNMPETILTPEAIAAAEIKGAERERARVAALNRWKTADPENEKLAQIVDEAVATGKNEADVAPQIQVAIRDFAKAEKPAAASHENPPKVKTADGSRLPEVAEDPASWSDDTIKANGKSLAERIRGSGPENVPVTESIRFRGGR